jgi:NAD-dependent SIR2 family protein deacetylase
MPDNEMNRERRDRNVYILGAGFSAPSGAPVVRDFLDKSRALYDDPTSGMSEGEQAQFKRVFEFKHTMAAAREKFVIDLDNIENLFGLVEISHRLGEGDERTRNDVIFVIAKTLQLSIGRSSMPRPRIGMGLGYVPAMLEPIAAPGGAIFRDEGQNNFTAEMYDYFAALVAGMLDDKQKKATRKDTIITFNYDLVCDEAIRRIGFDPNYHLPGAENLVGARNSDRSIDVLKLHGSTNWAICRNCHSVRILDRKLTEYLNHLERLGCCHESKPEFLLVPPSWDKKDYSDVIKSVWSKAVEELKAATRICIIGYSLPEVDAFFRYLLTLALSKNDHLQRVVVVDRQPAMEDAYKKVFDQTFRERRFEFAGRGTKDFGVAQFLGDRESLKQLSRGECVTRYLSCLP